MKFICPNCQGKNIEYWNSVKKTPPPSFEKLLVWITPGNGRMGYTDIGMFQKDEWSLTINRHMSKNVTHWVIPEEPKN